MYSFSFRNRTNIGEKYHKFYIQGSMTLEEAEEEALHILQNYISNDKYLFAKLNAVTKPDGSFDKDDFIKDNFFTEFYKVCD